LSSVAVRFEARLCTDQPSTVIRSTSKCGSISSDCQLVCFRWIAQANVFADTLFKILAVFAHLNLTSPNTLLCSVLSIMRTSSALLSVAAVLQITSAVPQRGNGGDQSHPINFEGPYGFGNEYCNLCPVSYCFSDRNVRTT